ncbi:hypothetical protein BDV59DRAFT_201299 [Aspergillus ambiguus]|uniref:uncharacterized protein n=1 Tax=Aspergillus ambiguus TaxID=176160 RepID=UPI003CCD6FDC
MLPTKFKFFKDQFCNVARSTPYGKSRQGIRGYREIFHAISDKTGAYVQSPRPIDWTIRLWGEASQVASAKEILTGLICKCSFDGPQPKGAPQEKGAWAKIPSKNMSKEADAEMKERREHAILQLRKEPEVLSDFPERLLFLWPKEGPSLSESLGQELESLDVVRAKFNCPLFVPNGLPGFIGALGQDHATMKKVAHCLRTKWVEIVTSSNMASKVYIIEPPNPAAMRKKIVVKTEGHLAKALLRGNKLKGLELESWSTRSDLIQSKNNARILCAVELSLKGVVFVRGHLRMRINLGLFALDEYRAPQEGKDSYSFEEFREMLLYEQTKGRLIPCLKVSHEEFLAKIYKATDLLEAYEGAPETLQQVEPAYSVNFEFQGSKNSMLRLEVEFSKSPLATEYEVTQRRWLRPRKSGQSSDRQPPLQVGVIDFERSDWQLEIKSLEFHEASSIDASLKNFAHSVQFPHDIAVGDIAAEPRRKVIFKDSPPVSRLVEKTALRYRLKGTDYALEIARYDEYVRRNTTDIQGQHAVTSVGQFQIPFTSWGASIFDPKWDNLLGQHANLPVGKSAKYNPNLDTFFPPKQVAVPNEKGAGLWELIERVKQVAELLGPTRNSDSADVRDTGSESKSFKTKVQSAGQEPSAPSRSRDSFAMLDADLGTLF